MASSVATPTTTTTTNMPTPAPPKTTSSSDVVIKAKKDNSVLTDQSQDIPMFLRKTYHMVDTCDPEIACWSDDGETFVVKDPAKFEQIVIPQFFKHSKFSSFVRQLNFYSFRKIKYADTIRIDPKLEAETANYWKFKHEKFLRGKPELLTEIKRMNSQKPKSNSKASTASNNNDDNTIASSKEESTALKSEVTTLKQRIEDMTKDINQLTSLVEQVTLTQKHQQQLQVNLDGLNSTVVSPSHKRKKIDITPSLDLPLPEPTLSAIAPMDIDASVELPPSLPSPLPASRETSSSELSDDGFVDQLFTAFKTGDFDFEGTESTSSITAAEPPEKKGNKPRPELMARLSDALALLPRDIQELIVDRLVESITSPRLIQENIVAANTLSDVEVGKTSPRPKPQSEEMVKAAPETPEAQANPGLNLAAATLAALLAQYGGDVTKDAKQANTHKSLPVIPVHA